MTNKDSQNNAIMAIIIAILLFIYYAFLFKKKGKNTKNDLAQYYKISRPTLAKWIMYFHPSISPLDWKAKRFLTDEEYESILDFFGKDTSQVLNKEQIFVKCDSDYKTLAGSVKHHLKKIGITEEIWKKCSVFPPLITQRIFIAMNGEDKEVMPTANPL